LTRCRRTKSERNTNDSRRCSLPVWKCQKT